MTSPDNLTWADLTMGHGHFSRINLISCCTFHFPVEVL
jgi:hypothetical protein